MVVAVPIYGPGGVANAAKGTAVLAGYIETRSEARLAEKLHGGW